MPNDTEIQRVMDQTGMGRMQAINHLRGRADAQRMSASREMLHALRWIAGHTDSTSAVNAVAVGAIAKATGE